MREILFAGEESQKRAPLLGGVIANGSAQHGVTRLKRIENGTLGNRSGDVERYLSINVCERAQVRWDFDSYQLCTPLWQQSF